ncbi:quinohemoprotein amine dehydrogenase subunit alpha [Sphingomonas spermidinifaciens]|nr:quinohemoprotein amine dehydrogenase subunit alpha [Sphingomonas spermidinifaciens]
MRATRLRTLSLLSLSAAMLLAGATASLAGAQGEDASPEKEAGIPVTDPLVVEKCGSCHAADSKGNLSRISWSRTTPEGWAQAIKRMVRLNGLDISPDQSRAIVASLSTSHGLSPEEAKAVMYIPEKRMIDETNIPNDDVRGACAACHAMGQPLSWRRSRHEWKLLQDLHVALYSQADAQYRRPAAVPPGAAPAEGEAPAKKRTRGEVALEWIRKAAPLHTPEWAAWSARVRSPKLAGEWLVTASVPGKGRYVGTMTLAAGGADRFTTRTVLRPIDGEGPAITRTGSGLVYAGYGWRGMSQGGGAGAPDALGNAAREAMWFDPDQKSGDGRWYWGEYHEFGYDVKLTRASAEPAVLAVVPGRLKVGTKGARLRILGHNLPAQPGDVDLGSGVTVRRVVSVSPGEWVVEADVAPAAPSGPRDVVLAGAVLEKAFPVYRSVDFMKVVPETGLARLGGARHPKGYQQFEALGFENGPDGKQGTADDVALGPIDVAWSIAEFPTVWYDDDVKFVGKLSPAALFTPNVDGPNPERRFGRNNYGEVWATATARAEKDKFGRPLTARGFLVVTVPSFQRWDQPEVSK